MKRLSQLLILAASLVALATGCKEVEENLPEMDIQKTVEVAPAGGVVTLDYTIVNPTEGAAITLGEVEGEEWIGSFVLDQEGKVSFSVAANTGEGAEPREGSFSLCYGTTTFDPVVVKQGVVGGSFSLAASNITPETIDVEVTATDPELTYLINIAPKSYIESLGGIEAYALVEAEYFRTSFYGDLLDDYLKKGNLSTTLTVQGAPEEPMLLWVAGIVRSDDVIRTPQLATTPEVYEFMFLPYPTLTLQSYSAELEADQSGTYSIKYTVENTYEAGEMKLELEESGSSWIDNLRIEDRTILFDYDANEYPIERSTQLYVSYSFSEVCIFYIHQKPYEEAVNVTFEITPKELHYDRVVVDCTPSDGTVKYALGAIAKSDFESYSYAGDPTKIPELGLASTYSRPAIVTGTQEEFLIGGTAYSYDPQWYIYAYAVDEAEQVATSEVAMVLVTLEDDRPVLEWDDERVNVTNSPNSFDTDASEQVVTLKYSITNGSPLGVVEIEESYDDMLPKIYDGKRVSHDAEAQTITFTISANTTKRARSTYLYLKYYSSAEDTSSDANITLKITQTKN